MFGSACFPLCGNRPDFLGIRTENVIRQHLKDDAMTMIIDYLSTNWHLLIGGGVLGFFVGTLTGLFGAGGGFIITPALNIVLQLPMNIAVGTSACQVLGASGFSLYHHLDRRMLGIRVAGVMGLGIPLGVVLGASVVEKLVFMGNIVVGNREVPAVNFILLWVFAGFLGVITAWLLIDNFWLRRGKHDDEANHKGLFAWLRIPPLFKFRTIPFGSFSVPVLVLLGFFVGFLSGLLGIGGGVIMMPLLFYVVGQQTKFATITSMMLVFVSGFFATISHAFKGNIDYVLVAFLIVGAFSGTKLGANIQKKISGKSLRKYFAFVVLAALIMVVVKLITMIA